MKCHFERRQLPKAENIRGMSNAQCFNGSARFILFECNSAVTLCTSGVLHVDGFVEI